jgi:hypothetical protein
VQTADAGNGAGPDSGGFLTVTVALVSWYCQRPATERRIAADVRGRSPGVAQAPGGVPVGVPQEIDDVAVMGRYFVAGAPTSAAPTAVSRTPLPRHCRKGQDLPSALVRLLRRLRFGHD